MRIYDYHLECGCLVSPDGAGGCIPCSYNSVSEACKLAWLNFKQSDSYKLYMEQLNASNPS